MKAVSHRIIAARLASRLVVLAWNAEDSSNKAIRRIGDCPLIAPAFIWHNPLRPRARHFPNAFALIWNNSSQPSVRASEIVLERRSSFGGLPQ